MPLQPAHAVLAALLALPWLWPFTSGPSAAVEPYLVAAAVAVPLLALWPRRAPDGGAAVAASGWLAAALLSSLIGLLQYFHLEAPFYPWINQAVPGQAFGNLRQPNNRPTSAGTGGAGLLSALPGDTHGYRNCARLHRDCGRFDHESRRPARLARGGGRQWPHS